MQATRVGAPAGSGKAAGLCAAMREAAASAYTPGRYTTCGCWWWSQRRHPTATAPPHLCRAPQLLKCCGLAEVALWREGQAGAS